MRAALLLLAPLLAGPEPAPMELRLEIETVAGATRRSLHLPGKHREPVPVRGKDGRADVLGIAGGSPQEGAHLWRLRGDRLETLREDLPSGTAGLLAADLDGDGRDDLALFADGRALLLRAGPDGRYAGPLETLVEDEDLELVSADFESPAGVHLRPGRLCAAVVGGLRCWSGSAALPWARGFEAPLPVSLARARDGLRLTGTPVQVLPGGAATTFAAGPVAEGTERLRVLLVTPDAAEDARTTECWLRLPSPERVLEHAFLRLNGEPALVVTTIPAGSFTLFGEKRLRVWPLVPDRTRTGRQPALAATSSMNLWQQAHFFAGDVSGDGRDDLVLGYWKGLKDSRVVLETWLRRPDGTLAPGAAGAAFDVEDGNRSALRWGTDADGDGRPDLLILAGGALQIHPGGRGRTLVSRTATLRIPVDEGEGERGAAELSISTTGGTTFSPGNPTEGRIRPVDLDGDGPAEWLVVGSTLSLVALPR